MFEFWDFLVYNYTIKVLREDEHMEKNNTGKIILASVVGSVIIVGALGTYLYAKDRINKKKIGGKLIKVDYNYSKEFND